MFSQPHAPSIALGISHFIADESEKGMLKCKFLCKGNYMSISCLIVLCQELWRKKIHVSVRCLSASGLNECLYSRF